MIHSHFTGRLGRDSKLGNSPDGTSVLNFAVATDDGYGDKKKTYWVDCALWGKRADGLAPYLLKGSQVVVHGTVGMREYQAADGTQRSVLTCRVVELDLVGKRDDAQAPTQPARQAPPAQPSAPKDNLGWDSGQGDDVPF